MRFLSSYTLAFTSFLALVITQAQAQAQAQEPCTCIMRSCLFQWPQSCLCANTQKKDCFEKCRGPEPEYQDCGVISASSDLTTTTTIQQSTTTLVQRCAPGRHCVSDILPTPIPCLRGQTCTVEETGPVGNAQLKRRTNEADLIGWMSLCPDVDFQGGCSLQVIPDDSCVTAEVGVISKGVSSFQFSWVNNPHVVGLSCWFYEKPTCDVGSDGFWSPQAVSELGALLGGMYDNKIESFQCIPSRDTKRRRSVRRLH